MRSQILILTLALLPQVQLIPRSVLQIHPSISATDRFRLRIWDFLHPAPGTLRQPLDPPHAARPLLPYRIVIISWNSRTPAGLRLLGRKNVSRNIRLRFNVHFAPKSSLVRIIYGHIFVLIPTNAHLSALSAERHLHGSTIASDMKDYTAEKKNSSAEGSLVQVVVGAVVEDLPVRTL